MVHPTEIIYDRGSGGPLCLDIYLASRKYPGERSPFVVWIHGGDCEGFDLRRGDKRPCPILHLLRWGISVVSVNYALSGAVELALRDCRSALNWLESNASAYGLDPARTGIIGFSVGGALAMILAAEWAQLSDTNPDGRLLIRAAGDCSSPVQVSDEIRAYSAKHSDGNYTRNTLLLRNKHVDSAEETSMLADEEYSRLDYGNKLPLKFPSTFLAAGLGDREINVASRAYSYNRLRFRKVRTTLFLVKNAGHGMRGLNLDAAIDKFFLSNLGVERNADRRDRNRVHIVTRKQKRVTVREFAGTRSVLRLRLFALNVNVDPVPAACNVASCGKFFSAVFGASVSYCVLLPPSYHLNKAKRFPVVYLMPANILPAWHMCDIMAAALHDAMVAGEHPEALYVFVKHFYSRRERDDVSWFRRNDRYVGQDLVPFVDKSWRTVCDRQSRLIVGYCSEGVASFRIAGRFPELFGSAYAMCPSFAQAQAEQLVDLRTAKDLKVGIGYGTKDVLTNMASGCADLHGALASLGINARLHVVQDGIHHPISLMEYDPRVLEFFRNALSPHVISSAQTVPVAEFKNCGAPGVTVSLRNASVTNAARIKTMIWLPDGGWPLNCWCTESGSAPIEWFEPSEWVLLDVSFPILRGLDIVDPLALAMAALRWIKEQEGLIGSGEVFIAGASGGGYLVAKLAEHASILFEKLAGVLIINAPLDWQSLDKLRWLDTSAPGPLQRAGFSFAKRFLEREKLPSVCSPMRLENSGGKKGVRTIFVHGALNRIVSLRQVRAFLHEAPPELQLIECPEMGHGYRALAPLVPEVLKRLVAENNGTKAKKIVCEIQRQKQSRDRKWYGMSELRPESMTLQLEDKDVHLMVLRRDGLPGRQKTPHYLYILNGDGDAEDENILYVRKIDQAMAAGDVEEIVIVLVPQADCVTLSGTPRIDIKRLNAIFSEIEGPRKGVNRKLEAAFAREGFISELLDAGLFTALSIRGDGETERKARTRDLGRDRVLVRSVVASGEQPGSVRTVTANGLVWLEEQLVGSHWLQGVCDASTNLVFWQSVLIPSGEFPP